MIIVLGLGNCDDSNTAQYNVVTTEMEPVGSGTGQDLSSRLTSRGIYVR